MRQDIESQLKRAIRDSGMTHYRISKISGVAPPVLCNFMSGKRTITLTTAAKIAKALGLELGPPSKKGR